MRSFQKGYEVAGVNSINEGSGFNFGFDDLFDSVSHGFQSVRDGLFDHIDNLTPVSVDKAFSLLDVSNIRNPSIDPIGSFFDASLDSLKGAGGVALDTLPVGIFGSKLAKAFPIFGNVVDHISTKLTDTFKFGGNEGSVEAMRWGTSKVDFSLSAKDWHSYAPDLNGVWNFVKSQTSGLRNEAVDRWYRFSVPERITSPMSREFPTYQGANDAFKTNFKAVHEPEYDSLIKIGSLRTQMKDLDRNQMSLSSMVDLGVGNFGRGQGYRLDRSSVSQVDDLINFSFIKK